MSNKIESAKWGVFWEIHLQSVEHVELKEKHAKLWDRAEDEDIGE